MSMANSLTLRTAEGHIECYERESGLMAQHAEAMECWECEAFLQLGIDAFAWIMRADRQFRMAIYRGEKEFNPEAEKSLHALCKNWLGAPCELAVLLIEAQRTRGYEIDNLEDFQRCVVEMTAIVKAGEEGDDHTTLPKHISGYRDEAADEHRNGQTAEFI